MEYVLLKTKAKVEAELNLASLTYNLLRVVNLKGLKWLENRLKTGFYGLFRHRALCGARQQGCQLFLSFNSQHSWSVRTALIVG